MNEFLKKNREFWSRLNIRQGGKKILVDEPRHPMIAHGNALYALLLNQAKGYFPVWLDDGKGQSLEFLQSYVSGAQTIKSLR